MHQDTSQAKTHQHTYTHTHTIPLACPPCPRVLVLTLTLWPKLKPNANEGRSLLKLSTCIRHPKTHAPTNTCSYPSMTSTKYSSPRGRVWVPGSKSDESKFFHVWTASKRSPYKTLTRTWKAPLPSLPPSACAMVPGVRAMPN